MLLISLILVSWSNFAFTQFSDATSQSGLSFYGDVPVFGNGISFFDYDEDGWDDLTVASNNYGVYVYHNVEGVFQPEYFFAGLPGDLKQPVWIDYDNDGDNDFFVLNMHDCPYLMRNDGNFQFTDVSGILPCESANHMSTCCSWGDYDNDSYPDLYVANYFESGSLGTQCWLFHNNGDGTFDEVADEMTMNNEGTNPAYQPTWIDFDQDSDLDLYLVNDKHAGCRLYINNGDNTFTDMAESFGLNLIGDCMGIAIGDYDHDTDYDVYVTNNIDINFFMENVDGQYEQVADEFNVGIDRLSWGCFFIDNNNTTWEDLYVVCEEYANQTNYYFENNSGNSFTNGNNLFLQPDNKTSFASAKGDFNRDGYCDMAVTHVVQPGIRLWENESSGGNFIRLHLNGTVSNNDAIGSTVRVFIDNTTLLRPLVCGDSYMSQQSQNLVIGIGEYEFVDSLTVTWPGGWVDRYYNLEANSDYQLFEGETYSFPDNIQTINFCQGDSVNVVAPEATSYLWSNGEVLQTLNIDQPGFYSVSFQNEFGLTAQTSFELLNFPSPDINTVISSVQCYGGNDGCINLEVDDPNSITVVWDDGYIGNSRCALTAGNYGVMITDDNGCEFPESLQMSEPLYLQAIAHDTLVCPGQKIQPDITVVGGVSPYNITWNSGNNEDLGNGSHLITVLDSNGCLTLDSLEIIEFEPPLMVYDPDTICIGSVHNLEYEIINSSGEYELDWFGENPTALSAGIYNVTIIDSHGCVSDTSVVVEKNPAILLNAEIQHAFGGDNGSIQIIVEGGTPPYLYEWNGEWMNSSLSGIGSGVYNVVVADAIGCIETITVEVIDLSSMPLEQQWITFGPNPFIHEILINVGMRETMLLYDTSGKLIDSTTLYPGNNVIRPNVIASGNYLLVIGTHSFLITKH